VSDGSLSGINMTIPAGLRPTSHQIDEPDRPGRIIERASPVNGAGIERPIPISLIAARRQVMQSLPFVLVELKAGRVVTNKASYGQCEDCTATKGYNACRSKFTQSIIS
jgi:hypothetical protein